MNVICDRVPVDRLQPILRREIAARAGQTEAVGGLYEGGFEAVCQALAAWSGQPKDSFGRRLSVILSGRDAHGFKPPIRPDAPASPRILAHLGQEGIRPGGRAAYRVLAGLAVTAGEAFALAQGTRRDITHVEFDTADRILTGLGLAELWHSELADLYGDNGSGVEAWCPSCETWTLGERCGWCDTRTVTAARMLERKQAGLCELCRRAAAGTVAGHRLCTKHEKLRGKLGPPIEQRLGLEEPAEVRPYRHDRLTEAHLAVLYRIYREERLGTPTLGAMIWERLGFPNATSASNAIASGFKRLGYQLRPQAESRFRNREGSRRLGFGGRAHTERRLAASTVDRLYDVYQSGRSSHEIARAFHARFGYETPDQFRAVYEHAWKVCGYRLRSNREAELLSRARPGRARCKAMKSGADGRRPRPCSQRPLDGSDYCLWHDPDHKADVDRLAEQLRNRKPVRPTIAWADVLPHLTPLLETRADRFGRTLEKPGGALARRTGVPAGTCSRLLLGRRDVITVELADRLLAPLELTVADLEPAVQLPLAA